MQEFTRSDSPHLPRIIEAFDLRELAQLATRSLLYLNHCYILYHNLHRLPARAPRKIGGGNLRRVRDDEIPVLYDRLTSLDLVDKRELWTRLRFYDLGFRECYAIDHEDRLAYWNWYVRPSGNELIRAKYGRKLAPLHAGEVMLENAFTFPECRGRGLMRYALWHLLNQANEEGHSRVVTYVRRDNLSSLNEFMGLGFRIHRMVRDAKALGYGWRAV